MTVVERMARAIDPEVWRFWDAGGEWHRDQQVIDRRAEAFSKAIAALEALRVPSEGMIWAFDDEMPEPTQEHYEHADLRRAYEAMIDAAISEHKGE